jgi:hypothetical protein
MPDLLLPRLKREIHARLAELRPLVAEAERLEAAKQALLAEAAAERAPRRPFRAPARTLERELTTGLRTNGHAAMAPGGAVAPAARPQPAGGDDAANGRAPRGANQDAILKVVEERPGVSVAEIASVTKIPKPTVATTVSKLKRERVLADEAGGVKLASRQRITLSGAASSRDEGVSDEEWEAAKQGAAA